MSTKAQGGFFLLLFVAFVAFVVINPVHGHNAPSILEVRTFQESEQQASQGVQYPG